MDRDRQKKYWLWNRSASLMIMIMCLSLTAGAQSDKRDYVWLFGHDSRPTQGFESYQFDFNKGSSPDSIRGQLPIIFAGNNASICDKNGNLLYYTNGCHVVGRDHQILPNGTGINEGIVITELLNDTCEAYVGLQDIMFLEDPLVNGNYYLLHKTFGYDQELFVENLKYSYIDGTLNNHLGDVVIKNSNLFNDSDIQLSSFLTAIEDNNNGFWITSISVNNSLNILRLNESGIVEVHKTPTETSFVENSSAGGTAKYSPDGNNFAFYTPFDDLHIYDFDRETGELTNHRYLLIKDFPDNIARFSSVEWSPNSRFIYISIEDQLWQVDTWEDDLEDGLVLIDTWNGVSDPFQTKFALMALAPDCKIYMCSFSSTNTYHVINNPNGKGQDCDFVQQGIRLPFVSSTATMPNFPRYRVDEEDKCDPTITSIFGEDIYWRRDLTCYPNPVRDILTVELPEQNKGQIVVLDIEGQIMMTREVHSGSERIQLSTGGLTAGTYSVEYIPERNMERRIWTSKIVKID